MQRNPLPWLALGMAFTVAFLVAVVSLSSCSGKAPQQDQHTGEVIATQPDTPLSDPYEINDDFLEYQREVRWPFPPVEFTFDHHNIPDSQVASLERQADYLLSTRSLVTLIGHTDPRGEEAYNYGLARRRARAVYDWLVRQGVPGELMLTAGVGSREPRNDGNTERYVEARLRK